MSQLEKVKCGLCHYEFDMGAHVCQGCRGDVVYGATHYELVEAGKVGALLWGFIALFGLYMLPILLNSQLGFQAVMGWGLGIYAMLIVFAGAIYGGLSGKAKVRAEKYGLIRTFRAH